MECEELDEERKQQMAKDEEEAAKERAKIQEKEDMMQAAKYVMKKWNWFQTEGKLVYVIGSFVYRTFFKET